MRSPATSLTAALIVLSTGVLVRSNEPSETVSTSLLASARIVSRTSLIISSELLQFALIDPAEPATATVDFVASARTHAGAEVMLTVEAQPTGWVGSEPGPREAITYHLDAGAGPARTLEPGLPVVAGRWSGSGRRAGRLSFTLRAPAAGSYLLPLRFVLTAP